MTRLAIGYTSLRLSIMALSILIISGCSSLSLVNPHAEWEPIDRSDFVQSNQQRTRSSEPQCQEALDPDECQSRTEALTVIEFRHKERISYARALQYADKARAAYKKALGNQAQLQSWLGIGLIPLSAAAIGLGASGVSPEAILALGLTGGATYGTGNWLINRPRQRAYVVGYNAITCAVQATQPLGFILSEQVAFEGDLALLRKYLRDTELRVGLVKVSTEVVERMKGSNDSQVKFAKQQVTSAEALIGTAEQALSSGGKLRTEVINAGRNLSSAVDKVGGEVQGLIVDTQLDLSQLFTIINGLGSAYSKFTAVPDSLKPTEEDEKPEPHGGTDKERQLESPARNELKTRLDSLSVSVSSLAAARRRVANVVNAVDAETANATLANCGVDESTVVSALTVDPAGPFQISGGKAGSVAFQIKGGQRPFHASLPAVRPAGLTIEQKPDPFSRGVVVTATKDVEAGNYVVSITDGSGERNASVNVVIVESKENPSKPEDQDSAASSACNQFKDETPGWTTSKVRGVEFAIESVECPDNGTQISVTLKQTGTPTGLITEQDIKEVTLKCNICSLLGLSSEQIEIANYVELIRDLSKVVFSDLSADDQKKIQAALCLKGEDIDAIWGTKTEAAFLAYQKTKNIDPPNPHLTSKLATQLLNETDMEQRCP